MEASKHGGAKTSAENKVGALTKRALKLPIVRTFLRYGEYRGTVFADAVTYRALFSIFAAVLLIFSVAALWLGGNPEAMKALADTVNKVIPGLDEVVDVTKIEAPSSFTIAGVISLAALIWASIGAVDSLRTALRVLADVPLDDGSIVWVYLRNFMVAVGFGGLLGLAAALSMVSGPGIETLAGWLGIQSSVGITAVTLVLSLLLIFAIDTGAIALIFHLLSGVKVTKRVLWTGAALGGLGLIVLQQFSSLFVKGATDNPLLASFAALIALLLWFNLSAQVILLAGTYMVVVTSEEKAPADIETVAQYRLLLARDRQTVADADVKAAMADVDKETR